MTLYFTCDEREICSTIKTFQNIMNMIADKNFTLVIEDGSTLFYGLNDIPRNFKEICLKLFGMVSSITFDMIFSTDMCHLGSENSMERAREKVG